MKKSIIIPVLILSSFAAQAQVLKKIKNKMDQTINGSVDKTVNKTIDKMVKKPLDNKTDQVLDKAAGNTTGNANHTVTASTAKDNGIIEKESDFPPESNVINYPRSITIDSKDNLYVKDRNGIVRVSPDGKIQRVSSYGDGLIMMDRNDILYSSGSGTIKKFTFDNKGSVRIEHYAGDVNYSGTGDGTLQTAKFNTVNSMIIAENGDIYLADVAGKLIKELGTVKSEQLAFEPDAPAKMKNENSWEWWTIIRKVSNGKVTTLKNSKGQYMLFANISGITLDKEGNLIYSGGGFSRAIRKLDLKTLQISNVAGKPFKREWNPVYVTGDTSKAELFDPGFLLTDKNNHIVYSDNRSHRITRVATGKVITMAGNNIIDPSSQNIGGRAQEGHKDGKAELALFNFPKGMVYDSKGNLYIVDSQNHVIRKLSADGIVSSFTPFDRSKAHIANY
ncbi:NHL repeat-containing protein [Gynurincola endophyticus]|uniref:hypothetical protein n=1 Tax=Gynurincola endophyticus TaxID=2479004 RepID=UPI000F8D0A33|nr:hypothetical protein [Gynurincola endophyticus]